MIERSRTLPTLTVASLLVLVGVVAPAAFADEAPMSDEPAAASPGYQEQVDRFFTTVQKGEYGDAIETLYSGNSWFAKEDLPKIRQQFETIPEVIGELHNYELLSKQQVSDRFVFLWYVGSFDRSPVSLYFKFYKPKDSWRFYSFEYKEDLGQVARDLAIDELKQERAAEAP